MRAVWRLSENKFGSLSAPDTAVLSILPVVFAAALRHFCAIERAREVTREDHAHVVGGVVDCRPAHRVDREGVAAGTRWIVELMKQDVKATLRPPKKRVLSVPLVSVGPAYRQPPRGHLF